jgi:hypothetical protein
VAAASGIGAAILIMIAASLVRGAWMRPPLVMPAAGPPWEITVRHVSVDLVSYGLWLAALLGSGGVAAGLLAIHRGARLSARILLIAGLHSQLLLATDHFAVRVMTPMVMLTAAIALVGLGLTGRWKLRDSPGAGPGTAAAGDAGRLSPAADSVCPEARTVPTVGEGHAPLQCRCRWSSWARVNAATHDFSGPRPGYGARCGR